LELTFNRLKDYVELMQPDLSRNRVAKAVDKICERVHMGLRDLADTRIIDDEAGQLLASIRLVPLGEGFWVLSELTLRQDAVDSEQNQSVTLIQDIMTRVHLYSAKQVFSRIRKEAFFEKYGKSLEQAGFRHIGERVEFKTPVSYLPDETGSPLAWKTMDETGYDLAIKLFGEVGQGAPDWDEDDDPEFLLRTYFSEPNLNSGAECVHIGYFNSEPAAFVLAQVSPDDGWSRITFMGVIPRFRGQGLGKWVHRHGFTMIRQQGGQDYQGGCLARNEPMMALFQLHGCREHCRVIEWVWKAGTESPQE
jgi:hypothetical protein